MQYDYDYIIVGSGFGGSVSALRLAEKGYRVAVLEMGRRIDSADMEAAAINPLKLFWMPRLGMRGYFVQTVLRHVGIVGGVGVGGGSIVYAAVLLEPPDTFFHDPAWNDLHADWQGALAPHYETAKRMLGRNANPYFARQDDFLRETASAVGADNYDTVPLGIYFGEPGVDHPDPYFDGDGPQRTGCEICGACLTGCPHNAKNSLDRNYLYLAEQLGAQILPEHQVTQIAPLPGAGYVVESVNPFDRKPHRVLTAQSVILAAGVLGTLRLLYHCRDVAQTLPRVSLELGRVVRTNSEAIVGVVNEHSDDDLSRGGPAITSHFYPNDHTHITQNRFPQGYSFMRWYMGPLVDGANPRRRALKALGEYVRHPRKSTAAWRGRNWHQRVSVISVMQQLDNQIRLRYGRSPMAGMRYDLQSEVADGERAPAYIPEANAAAREFAKVSGGEPLNVLLESVGNLSITAHILGGCHMGVSAENGVIDTNHEVHNYPGLYVIDGASVSANVGVNPSLTITALAERAMSLIPPVGA